MSDPRQRATLDGRGGRLFGWLLRAYPAAFRARFGAEMRAVFAERLHEELEQAGRWGVLRLWLRSACDLAATGCAQRAAAATALAARLSARAASSPCRHRQVHRQGDGTMSKLFQDLGYALRALRKAPGLTLVSLLTLGVAIGANTAVFSIVNGVLLRPLPYGEPERLFTLWERGADGKQENVGYATFVDWQSRIHSLQSLAAIAYWAPSVSGSGTPERLEGLRVTRDFFRTLGVRPAIGRDFLPEEDQRGRHHVAIVSYELWQRRFGGDPQLVGKTIVLDGLTYTLVGVLPRGHQTLISTGPNKPAEIWAPLAYNSSLPWACRDCHHLRVVARLGRGVPLVRASAELDALSRALFAEYPKEYEAPGVIFIPLEEYLLADYRRPLAVLLGAVGFVLAIACANISSVQLARSQRRQGEIAVRTALGATRSRLAQQLLTESVLLHLLGGCLGLLLAAGSLSILVRHIPPNIPRLAAATVDARVLAATFAVCLLTGVAAGLAPARHLLGSELRAAASAAGAGTAVRRRRLSGVLVSADVALALVLVIGTGLMVRSMLHLLAVDVGFETRGLLAAEISVSGPRFDGDAKIVAFYDRVLERVRSLPGVEVAAVTSQLPLGGDFDGRGVRLFDRPNQSEAERSSAQRYAVSPDYLRVMRIPLLRGRGFGPGDLTKTAPAVMINKALSERVWPGQEPLGKRLQIGGPDQPWRTVVGVVGDTRHVGLDLPPPLQLYLPQRQFVDSDMILVVRTAGEPQALAAAVRRAIWEVDPDRPITRLATMDRVVEVSLGRRLLLQRLLILFAAIAVLLAMIGIYGVLSCAVGERTREIGVRMALGARRSTICALILGAGARQTAAGLAAGVVLALALTRFLGSLLYGVTAQDPITFGGLALLLAGVAALAAYLPARRAMGLDPVAAVRAE
ncbi:MAG TPA: ABC transporter permease [Thermoanaerobaculia bacterium]|nr:ABC transporter permease [Thermoanaerobaculia bacterium]